MNIPYEPIQIFGMVVCLAVVTFVVGLWRWILRKEDDRDMVVSLAVVAFVVGLLLLFVYLQKQKTRLEKQKTSPAERRELPDKRQAD